MKQKISDLAALHNVELAWLANSDLQHIMLGYTNALPRDIYCRDCPSFFSVIVVLAFDLCVWYYHSPILKRSFPTEQKAKERDGRSIKAISLLTQTGVIDILFSDKHAIFFKKKTVLLPISKSKLVTSIQRWKS